jgi:hypothetical protein
MLTQAMPALTKALAGMMPPAAIRQITQALGNCSQGVVQRGDVTLTPSSWANVNNGYGSRGGTGKSGGPGTYTGNAWSPQNYKSLFDNTSTNNTTEFDLRNNIDIAGNTYYHSDGGSFPIYFNQTSTNNYGGATYATYGGTTFGDTYITDIPGSPGKNGERGEAAVDGINGEYFSYTYDGEAGADGSNGGDGQPGGAGAAGAPGGVGAKGRWGIGVRGAGGAVGERGAAGINGRDAVGQDGVDGFGFGFNGAKGFDGINGIDGFGAPFKKALAVVAFRPIPISVTLRATVPKYSFDSETCSLVEDGTDNVVFAAGSKEVMKSLTIVPDRQPFFRPQ